MTNPENLKKRISSLDRIPTLPVIANQIMQIAQDENKSLRQLVPIIEKDPPLAIKVLKMANAAYYGLRRQVDSLRDAVMILGMDSLYQMALSFSVMKVLETGKMTNAIAWDKFWEHSAAVGHIAELLKKKLQLRAIPNAFSLGLLHDIGKLVFYKLEPEAYSQLIISCAEEDMPLYNGEIEKFGVSHEQIGIWVAEKWQLPTALITSVGYHHRPHEATKEMQLNAALVQIANLVANLNEISFGAGFFQTVPRELSGWKIIQETQAHLAEMDFELFVMSIQDEINHISEIVKLIQG
ncbi:MAG TPA: HDOD domain-containing protein [Candidatus Marinimicrobia bacterium]|nr:HDOD domain-containing protein [Candidatus Neomarinimicrobiota bacterium]